MLIRLIAITLLLFSCFTPGFSQQREVTTLYFKNNSYAIGENYLLTLDEIGKKCMSDRFSYLKIFAYADTKGTKSYNELLSEKRAMAVYDYLVQRFAIDTSRIYITWLGEETDGLYELHFPEAKVQQRCVDILVFFTKPPGN